MGVPPANQCLLVILTVVAVASLPNANPVLAQTLSDGGSGFPTPDRLQRLPE